MMRSLFSGITGLRSHQTKMDVVGNNIANVNTQGFKKSAVTFADIYSETMSPASAPAGNTGGINAKQVGLGTSVNAIIVKHSSGAPTYTGNSLDLAISGDGYFVVRTAEGNRYTRSGNFSVSSNGGFVNPSGFYVQTYGSLWQNGDAGKAAQTGMDGKSTSRFSDFKFTQAGKNVRGVTTEQPATDFNDGDVVATPSGTYTFKINLDGDPTSATPPADYGKITVYRDGIEFATGLNIVKGDIKTTAAAGGNPETTEATNTKTALTYDEATIVSTTPGTQDMYYIEIPGVGTVSVAGNTKDGAAIPNIATDRAKKNNFTDLATVINNATVIVTNNDGFVPNAGEGTGDLIVDREMFHNITVNDSGAIVGQLRQDISEQLAQELCGPSALAMKKGEMVVLGYVALATFSNNEGLEKIATNLYQDSQNSGNPQMNVAGTPGYGSISPSSLEMSNVDLSEEMVNMIVTQRGFQANSKVITVTDTMLEDLVNLKR